MEPLVEIGHTGRGSGFKEKLVGEFLLLFQFIDFIFFQQFSFHKNFEKKARRVSPHIVFHY